MISQDQIIFDIRIPNMPLLKAELEKRILQHKEFEYQFKDVFKRQANDVRRLAAMYAPRDRGVLDKPKIESRQYLVTGGFGRNTYVTFTPDYSAWLQFGSWGPAKGRPFRPGTAAKRARTGAPIGPQYASRALADFRAHVLQKTSIKPFGKFAMKIDYSSPSILGG